ncbi:hypothetical protein [Entomohabitans teleogrylli]|uniref:hypothetical protein n=1 Tax=Entomohabitans teleogrylli TaxID=1384589 RepID=UPI00073D7742|nr:hypothetical protein [Entomohabitans teleogrylli]
MPAPHLDGQCHATYTIEKQFDDTATATITSEIVVSFQPTGHAFVTIKGLMVQGKTVYRVWRDLSLSYHKTAGGYYEFKRLNMVNHPSDTISERLFNQYFLNFSDQNEGQFAITEYPHYYMISSLFEPVLVCAKGIPGQ